MLFGRVGGGAQSLLLLRNSKLLKTMPKGISN